MPQLFSFFWSKVGGRQALWCCLGVSFNYKCSTTSSWGVFNAEGCMSPPRFSSSSCLFSWSFVSTTYVLGARWASMRRDDSLLEGWLFFGYPFEERVFFRWWSLDFCDDFIHPLIYSELRMRYWGPPWFGPTMLGLGLLSLSCSDRAVGLWPICYP